MKHYPGLYGRVDENGNVTEYVFANTGTYMEVSKKGLNSLWEDIKQVFGKSTDMDLSLICVNKVLEETAGKELTFVGHSKGGGEAAGNALKHNKNALLYNPAAINSKAMGLDKTKYTGEKIGNGRQGMTVYVVEGEILHSVNIKLLKAKPIDGIVIVPHRNNDDNKFQKHKILEMIEDIRNENYK